MEIIEWDGQPISVPGIYSSIPMSAYHGQLTIGPSASSSTLRTIFSASPAHYFVDSYLNPANWETVDGVLVRKEQPDSEPFLFGRAAHHLLLGEADFRQHFTIRPPTYHDDKTDEDKPWNGNSTFCRKWLALAKREGLTVLKGEQIECIRGMAAALSKNPLVAGGALNGDIEHSFVWKDEETGIWLKWRPDAIPTDDMDFADLKAVADISDAAIERSIGDYGYNQQGALGAWGCRALLAREMNSFNLVCAEKKPPHCIQIRPISMDAQQDPTTGEVIPSDLELGEIQNRAALRLFALCVERNEWPGPGSNGTDLRPARLNSWARRQIENRIKAMNLEMFGSEKGPA